jgi:hypothetical protein
MPRSGETAMIVKRQSLAASDMKYRMQDCIDRYKRARVMIFFAGVAQKFPQLKKSIPN